MVLGFFYGIGGDAAALGAALELLADCDRVISLGDLLAGPGPGDAACLGMAAGKVQLLEGRGERLRSRDRTLPAEVRVLLERAIPATVEDGVAILGGTGGQQPSSRAELRAADGAPRLVAPLTIAATLGTTRVWRNAGGLARVEELGGPLRLQLPPAADGQPAGERLRLDLGKALGADGVVRVAVLDAAAGTLELRERALVLRHPEPAPPRRIRTGRRKPPPVAEGQQRLAV